MSTVGERSYLNLLSDILENGVDKDDRTGVGTRSVFGRQLRFNMNDGFPALTTKKLAWKAVVSELLWFLEGSTSTHRLAEIKNDNKPYHELDEKERFTIWNANYECQGKKLGYVSGNLGRIYSAQWVNLYDIDFDKYEIVDNVKYIDDYVEPVFEKLIPQVSKDKNIGKIYKSNRGKYLQIISKVSKEDKTHSYYLIQFLETNSTKIERFDAIKKGLCKDDYEPSLYGVGKLGDISEDDKKQEVYRILVHRWQNMISRCYNIDDKLYPYYGAKGVKVCKRWHTLSNFLEDAPQLFGFQKLLENNSYEIDKDIYGAKIYSPKTSLFVPKEYNIKLCNCKPLVYKDEIYLSVKDFCDKNDFASESGLRHHLNGRYTKKYSEIKRLEIPDGKHVRYKLVKINQVQNVIDTIRKNPNDRRLLVVAWNPVDLPLMALPPCHMMYQFYVSGNRLSLMWYQRSVDTCTGLPFNIASYALLLHIIAKMTNLIPCDLIGTLGDTHIYKNHFEGAMEQIKREPHELPTLEMPDIDWSGSIDDVLKQVKTSDFKLINYVHDDPIKYEMAV